MSHSKISELIHKLFKEAGTNIPEERATEYIISEIHKGRRLSDILEDPYVKSTLGSGHLRHVLEHKEIISEVEAQLKASLAK